MMRGGISDPRNKVLMKLFNLIKIGERAGSGVPDIFCVWENENYCTPSIEEQFHPNRTILILPFTKKVTIKSDDKVVEKKFYDDQTMIIKDVKAAYHVAVDKSDDKKVTIKSDDKKHKTYVHQQAILAFMEKGVEYRLKEFCELLSLKETRVKVLLKDLIDEGSVEVMGANRNRRYRRK